MTQICPASSSQKHNSSHKSFFKIKKTSYTWPLDTDAAMEALLHGSLVVLFICFKQTNNQIKPDPWTQNSYTDAAMEALLHGSLVVVCGKVKLTNDAAPCMAHRALHVCTLGY